MTIDIEVKEYVDQEMSKVYEKLEVIEKVLVGRIENLEKGLNYRMDGLEARMDGLGREFGSVRDMVAILLHLYQPLLAKCDEMIKRFGSLEEYVRGKFEGGSVGYIKPSS